MTAYVGLEPDADSIRLYHPSVVHGLFQTPAYAEALYAAEQDVADVTNAFIGKHLGLRAERRRRVLQRQPKPVTIRAILGEGALRAIVGNSDVMQEQWRELAFLSRLQHVHIQVLPFTSPGYRGLHDFAILALPSPLRTLVQADTAWGAVSTSDKPWEVARFVRAFDEMSSYALAPAETPDFLHHLSEERVTT
nr:DUF5753 domain-containing protein [Streptomyces sp. SID11385]